MRLSRVLRFAASAAAEPYTLVSEASGTAIILTLNRPSALNALTKELVSSLRFTLSRALEHREFSLEVLRGAAAAEDMYARKSLRARKNDSGGVGKRRGAASVRARPLVLRRDRARAFEDRRARPKHEKGKSRDGKVTRVGTPGRATHRIASVRDWIASTREPAPPAADGAVDMVEIKRKDQGAQRWREREKTSRL